MLSKRQHSLLDEYGMHIITVRGIYQIRGMCSHCGKLDKPLYRNTNSQYWCAVCIRSGKRKKQTNAIHNSAHQEFDKVQEILERQGKVFDTREQVVHGKDTHGMKKPTKPSSLRTTQDNQKQPFVAPSIPPTKTIEQLEVESLCEKGEALLKLRRYEDALKVFQEAIQLTPKYAYAHQGASFAWHYLGDEEMALGERMKAVKLGL